MSFIKIKHLKKETKFFRNGHAVVREFTRKVLLLKCDYCGNEFTKKYTAKFKNQEHHYCSRPCVSSSDITKKKREQSNIKSFGVKNISQLPHIKKKKEETCMSNYGVKYPLQSAEVQEKLQNTCLEVYGVKSPMQSPEVQQLFEQSFLETYGVNNPSKLNWVKEKKRQSLLENYGVENPMQSQALRERYFLSLKNNGNCVVSKPENICFDMLCNIFGWGNVERQAEVNGWLIDFYISSHNLYIESDSVFWHGGGYSYDELLSMAISSESMTGEKSRFRSIAETKLRDKEKDAWFAKNNKILIRVDSKETLGCNGDCSVLKSILNNRLENFKVQI